MRIVQFSDLHLGESAGADNDTLALMRAVLTHERPELVIFIGDQVSGFDVLTDAHRLALWGQAVSVAAERQLPFATLFGNHDDQPYHLNSLLWNGVALLVIMLCSVCALCWPQRNPKPRRGIMMVALVALECMRHLLLIGQGTGDGPCVCVTAFQSSRAMRCRARLSPSSASTSRAGRTRRRRPNPKP